MVDRQCSHFFAYKHFQHLYRLILRLKQSHKHRSGTYQTGFPNIQRSQFQNHIATVHILRRLYFRTGFGIVKVRIVDTLTGSRFHKDTDAPFRQYGNGFGGERETFFAAAALFRQPDTESFSRRFRSQQLFLRSQPLIGATREVFFHIFQGRLTADEDNEIFRISVIYLYIYSAIRPDMHPERAGSVILPKFLAPIAMKAVRSLFATPRPVRIRRS